MVVGGREPSGTGRLTKLGFAVQVGFALLLAVAVCAMVVHLSEWRRVRARVDLTASGRNTLDPVTEALLTDLPEPVQVDLFFRPAAYEHFRAATAEAQERTTDLLIVAKGVAGDRLEVRSNDPYDLAATQERMQALGISEDQCAVVSRGTRRAVLRLFGELAELDPGNPDPNAPRPASVRRFRGEEALAEALKKVHSSDEPVVCFAAGHGEVDAFGSEPRQLGSLSAELERQGFRVRVWRGADGPVPDDCTVLAVVAPEQPMSEREVSFVDAFLARGGRALVATETAFTEEPGSATALLRRLGMLLRRGIVCLPVLDYFGNLVEERPECVDFRVSDKQLDARHPVTAPLVERGRSVRVSYSRSFDIGAPPEGGVLLELMGSPADAWLDLPLPAREGETLDFRLDPDREPSGRFRLAMVATFPPTAGGDPAAGGERREARVIGLASPLLLSNAAFALNRDFALNAFNWLAERDFRVGVSQREPRESALDVTRGPAMAIVFHASLWGLPGVFGLLGLGVWVRRRR